jgi:hypothetical protein
MSCVPTGPPVAAAEVSERRLTGGGAAAGAAASAAASSSSSVAGGDGDVAQLHDAPHVSGSGGSSSSSSAATDQDDGMLDATLHGAPQADDGSGSSSSGSSSMLPDHSDPWGGDGDGLGPLDGAGYYEGLGYYEDDDDDDGYYGDYDDEEDDDDGTGLPPIPRRRGRSSAPEAEYYVSVEPTAHATLQKQLLYMHSGTCGLCDADSRCLTSYPLPLLHTGFLAVNKATTWQRCSSSCSSSCSWWRWRWRCCRPSAAECSAGA